MRRGWVWNPDQRLDRDDTTLQLSMIVGDVGNFTGSLARSRELGSFTQHILWTMDSHEGMVRGSKDLSLKFMRSINYTHLFHDRRGFDGHKIGIAV